MQYIILESKNGSLRRAFKVLGGDGFRPRRRKQGGSDSTTVTGKPDYEFGPVTQDWQYRLKILEGEAGSSVSHPSGTLITATSTPLGSLDDLKTFFGYNTVSELPLKMMDLDESEHEVVFTGELAEELLSYYVTGPNAYFNIPVELKKTDV